MDGKQDFERNVQTVMRLFIRVDRAHRGVFEKRVKEIGVHRSQHRLLMHLSHFETVPSQKQIAEHFEISPSAVAVSLKKLEKAGYIERGAASGDSRNNEIRITDAGREIVSRSKKIFAELDEVTFGSLSDEEMKSFAFCLEKILCSLRKFDDTDGKGGTDG